MGHNHIASPVYTYKYILYDIPCVMNDRTWKLYNGFIGMYTYIVWFIRFTMKFCKRNTGSLDCLTALHSAYHCRRLQLHLTFFGCMALEFYNGYDTVSAWTWSELAGKRTKSIQLDGIHLNRSYIAVGFASGCAF